MSWQWRTTPDGFVEVDRNGDPSTCVEFRGTGLVPPAGTFERLLLPDASIYRTMVTKVLAWRALAEKHAARTGVPAPWILAFMYAEGGGDPNAQLQEPSGAVGVGLMALTAQPAAFPATWGITMQEAFEPDKNVAAGTDFMARLKAAGHLDLPQLASTYNAGPGRGGQPKISLKSAWGMVEYCGPPGGAVSCCHIERVVRAHNTVLAALGVAPPLPLPFPLPVSPSPEPAAASGATQVVGMLAIGAATFYGTHRYLRRRRA